MDTWIHAPICSIHIHIYIYIYTYTYIHGYRLRFALRVVHEQYVRAEEEKKAFEAGLQQQGGRAAVGNVFMDHFQRLSRYSMYFEQVCVGVEYACVYIARILLQHRCSWAILKFNCYRLHSGHVCEACCGGEGGGGGCTGTGGCTRPLGFTYIMCKHIYIYIYMLIFMDSRCIYIT
jgi:hypothetical protein